MQAHHDLHRRRQHPQHAQQLLQAPHHLLCRCRQMARACWHAACARHKLCSILLCVAAVVTLLRLQQERRLGHAAPQAAAGRLALLPCHLYHERFSPR